MSRYLQVQQKKIYLQIILLSCLICSTFFLPHSSQAQNNVVAIVKVNLGTNVNQLAVDHQATVIGAIPSLAQYRLQSASPYLLSNLAADYRVQSVQSEIRMDARPRWIGADGQDALSPVGGPFVATNPPPPQYTNQWAAQLVRTEQAHTLVTGSNVIIAVLDTGIDLDHPWLANKILTGYDFVDHDSQPAEEANGLDFDGDTLVDEAAGHGTHVAGIVALAAPDAKIMPIRIFNSDGIGSYFNIAQGIVYAVDHGADVINLSGSGADDVPLLQDAVAYAESNNVVFISSGGINSLDYPASYDSVISVGASDANDYAQPFAEYAGNTVSVYAPGASIFSAYHDNSGISWSGNSMATPFVAGGAALLLSTGSCDYSCVYDTISDSAHPVYRNGLRGHRLDLVDLVTAVSDTSPDLVANYHVNPSDSPTDDSIQPFIQIQNNGQSIALHNLTIRYWYQTDTAVSEEFHCDYTDLGCAHLTGSFINVDDNEEVNRYFELGFADNDHYLLGGRSSGDIVLRINRIDHVPYNEANHYSYDGTVSEYVTSDRITLYYQGELVWGSEPTPPNAPPPPASPCTLAAWNASQVYLGGNQVSYDGNLYQAKWWTTNEQPDLSGQWGVWSDLGPCQ